MAFFYAWLLFFSLGEHSCNAGKNFSAHLPIACSIFLLLCIITFDSLWRGSQAIAHGLANSMAQQLVAQSGTPPFSCSSSIQLNLRMLTRAISVAFLLPGSAFGAMVFSFQFCCFHFPALSFFKLISTQRRLYARPSSVYFGVYKSFFLSLFYSFTTQTSWNPFV